LRRAQPHNAAADSTFCVLPAVATVAALAAAAVAAAAATLATLAAAAATLATLAAVAAAAALPPFARRPVQLHHPLASPRPTSA
jgi:hypothetical protein